MEREAVEKIKGARERMGTELAKVIVGQDDVIEHLFIAVLAGGHCLLTGAPGLAKTLLVHSLSQLFDLSFCRIQFTPDLMPADITGTEILEEVEWDGSEAAEAAQNEAKLVRASNPAQSE